MSIIEAFKKYKDDSGLIQNRTDGVKGIPSQNGQLFTFEYLIILMSDESTPEEDKLKELESIKDALKRLEYIRGTTLRHVSNMEGNSMDNNGMQIVFSDLYDNGRFAKDMREVGLKAFPTSLDDQDPEGAIKLYPVALLLRYLTTAPWKWKNLRPNNYWHNVTPQKFCSWGWYGRSPGFMAMLAWAAGEKVGLLGKLSLLIGQFIGILTTKKTNSDARKLPYAVWFWLAKKGWFWRQAYKLWAKLLLREQGPYGMKAVYAQYYGEDHPLTIYSKPHFEV